MHDRHDLTDAEWDRLEPQLPDRTPARGGRWPDHRQVINGVFWRTRTGAPWRDLPTSYGIKTTIPEKSDQQKARAAKGSAGGRPPKSGTTSCKQRNTAERAFNKLKAFRAVGTRTGKREYVFQGTIDVASIKIWLRHPATQDPPDPA